MDAVAVELASENGCMRTKFFPASAATPAATALLFRGWPGNPDDVLGLGAALSGRGIRVCVFNLRGLEPSPGMHTQEGTLQDIGAAWDWLAQPDVRRRFAVDPARLV